MDGYLYFVVNPGDLVEDGPVFVKIGRTRDPGSRLTNYVSHHVGPTPPVIYKLWKVKNDVAEEAAALDHFSGARVVKDGSSQPSEVIRAPLAEVDRYRPSDPGAVALAPHSFAPSEGRALRIDRDGRFEEHWADMAAHQGPVIRALTDFFLDPADLARVLRAPCGTGKTRMASAAIREAALDMVYVVCPTILICEQWARELGRDACVMSKSDFGKVDATDKKYRVLTYASCTDMPITNLAVYIFDEAHHTAGTGVTKTPLGRVVEAGAKRLSITFTPRTSSDPGANSMDDAAVYGPEVPFPTLGTLVDQGLAPDYRLTVTSAPPMETLRATASGVPGARKIVVYLPSVADALATAKALEQENLGRVCVVSGEMAASGVAGGIDDFLKSDGRAWLLSCLVLLEGADLPGADTVVVLAPWQTNTRLMQLLLRPGRWYPRKVAFNVVVPEDAGGYITACLREAGFDVSPSKHRNLARPPPERGANPHYWCVSYTQGSASTDFDRAHKASDITANIVGLDKAKPGDAVILRGGRRIAFARIHEVSSCRGDAGKTATSLKVEFAADGIITLEKYELVRRTLWGDRKDYGWIVNPRYNAGNKYDTERAQIIEACGIALPAARTS